jgi:hypothetical protein
MVQRQPGSNVIEVNDEIKKVLPQLKAQMPPNFTLDIRSDRCAAGIALDVPSVCQRALGQHDVGGVAPVVAGARRPDVVDALRHAVAPRRDR